MGSAKTVARQRASSRPISIIEPGSVIDIGILDARCRATVLAEPIYDPANERLAS